MTETTMTEPKHTPAPWELATWTDPGLPNSASWEVEGADGAHIAQNYHGGNDRETEFANARLIAAAPELLEAAVEVLKQDCVAGRCIPFCCNPCAFAKLQDAVDKAGGNKSQETES